jgi:hypothetical protein
MDWKMVAKGTAFHDAKDVASFANHLGGTLLIGAEEADGHLKRYVGLDPADAGLVRSKFSNAVKERCEPIPRIDFAEYSDPNGATKKIVAVNVWPSLLLIGVRLAAHKPSEGFGGDSYVYPVRAGIDADYLTPSQIAMYMTPNVRRIAVMISKIPKDAVVTIWTKRNQSYKARYRELKEDENLAILEHMEGTQQQHNVPLDCIKTVYEAWDTQMQRSYWRMHLDYGLQD